MAIMGNRNRIIFIVGLLLQLQGSSQIDKDENRPYEFSFTIDGEQHRYEKKDVQGIIQGEFGFITGDGIYHVTVYATDENGSFKILSMKNVRVSGPLDGSSYGDSKVIPQELVSKYINKPISPETKYTSKPFGVPETKYTNKPFGITETKYTNKPFGISETKYTNKPFGITETKYTNKPFGISETKYTSKPFGISETKYTNKPFGISETKYTSKSPYIFSSQNVNQYSSQIYTSTPRTTLFKITTVSTIRPGCGGCGIIARTTPKTKLPQNSIQFSNNKPNVEHAYPRPLSIPPPSSKPNYNSNSIYNNNDKPNVPNNFRPETYETTTKSALHYNYNFENHAKPESAKPPVYNSNNYNDNAQTYEITTKSALHYNYNFDNHAKPESTKPPVTRGNNFNYNYETTKKSSLQYNYNFDQVKPEFTNPPVTNRGNSFNENNNYKPESYSTTTKPSLSNNNFGNTFKPQSYGTTTKPTQFTSNNFNFGSSSKATFYTPTPSPDPFTNKNYGSSSKAPFYTPTPSPDPFTSKNYGSSSKATFYNPTTTPEPFTSKTFGSSSKASFYNPNTTPKPLASKTFETSTKRESNNYNAVQFNPITPSKIDLQGNKDVVYPLPLKQKYPISAGIKTDKENIYVPGNNPIHIKDKYPNMKEGLPNGITESDIVGLLYKFNYTVGFHGHYEKGWNNGTKTGGYFVNGRDGYSRVVTYVADENGYRPKFRLIHLGYDSPDTPKADSEKKFGLKNFEFVWYPIN